MLLMIPIVSSPKARVDDYEYLKDLLYPFNTDCFIVKLLYRLFHNEEPSALSSNVLVRLIYSVTE